MPGIVRFLIFMAAASAVFIAVLLFTTRKRISRPGSGVLLLLASVVVVFGMRMTRREIVQYLPLALVMGPAIHLFFSLFIGWHDYMPCYLHSFIPRNIPKDSLTKLLHASSPCSEHSLTAPPSDGKPQLNLQEQAIALKSYSPAGFLSVGGQA